MGRTAILCVQHQLNSFQCDEATPACGQCINTKRTCPGYVARFDLVLRDQTKSVRRKAQRQKASGNSSRKDGAILKERRASREDHSGSIAATSSTASAHPASSTADSIIIKKQSPAPGEGLPRMLNDFPEQQAICALFLDFVLLPRHPDSIRGHLEHLLPLYQAARPDSAVSLATSSVALLISGNSRRRVADQQLSQAIFGRALLKTSTAIGDPIDSVTDATLMAVLLLGLYEVCCHLWRPRIPHAFAIYSSLSQSPIARSLPF